LSKDPDFLSKLRLLILFGIAMPLKYIAGRPGAVTIAGSVHGLLFIALVTMFILATRRVPISRGIAAAGIVAAIVPFGPFIMDRWLRKAGNENTSKQAAHPR